MSHYHFFLSAPTKVRWNSISTVTKSDLSFKIFIKKNSKISNYHVIFFTITSSAGEFSPNEPRLPRYVPAKLDFISKSGKTSVSYLIPRSIFKQHCHAAEIESGDSTQFLCPPKMSPKFLRQNLLKVILVSPSFP